MATPNYQTFIQPEDEHFHVLIKQDLALCQTTMKPIIEESKKIALKAHDRLDGISERMTTLDHEKTGMVTRLWEDSEMLRKQIRNTLYTVVLMTIVFGITSVLVSREKKDNPLNPQIIGEIVKSVMSEVRRGGI
jgi:hypothetical protein